MTKRLLILLFALSALPAFAQAKRYYCEIKGIENGFSAGLKIIFDLGDDPTYNISGSLSSKQELVDGNGEKIRFNSMVGGKLHGRQRLDLSTGILILIRRPSHNTLDILQGGRVAGEGL